LDADSNKAASDRPGRVVAEAGKVGDTTVPPTASGTRHEMSIRGGRLRSAQLLITPHPVASLRSWGTVGRRYRSDWLPRRRCAAALSASSRARTEVSGEPGACCWSAPLVGLKIARLIGPFC